MRRASHQSWIMYPAVPVLPSLSPTALFASPRPRPPHSGGYAAPLHGSRFSTLDSQICPSSSRRLTPPTLGSRVSTLVSRTLWQSIESTIRISFESVARPNRTRRPCTPRRPSRSIREDHAPAAVLGGGVSNRHCAGRTGHCPEPSPQCRYSTLPLTQRACRLVLYFGRNIGRGSSLGIRDMIALHHICSRAAQKR